MTTVSRSLNKLLRTQLVFMKDYYDIHLVSKNDDNGLERLGTELELPYHEIPFTRKITPFTDVVTLFKTYKLFRKQKPFIVHTHTPKAGLIGMMAAKLARVPNRLHTVAGMPLMETTGIKRKLLNQMEKLTYGCATKVYPNSNGLREFIEAEKFTKKTGKLKVLANGSSNGIDVTHFSPKQISEMQRKKLKEEIGIQTGDFVFLFVGRMVKDKGVNELIAAFEKLQKEHAECKLMLLGRFEDELDPLKAATVKILNENPSIFHMGYQNDVRPYFAIADAFVFPSYREGFPNVVMQACAMEVPSIVSNINGCNELIEHQKNGIIIPTKNEEATYKEMLHFFADREKLSTYAKLARKHIVEKYKRELVWEAILKEYKSLENK